MNVTSAVYTYLAEGLQILASKGYNLTRPQIKMNRRLTRSLGRAVIKTDARTGVKTYTVEINAKAFTSDSPELRETVLHEIAHIAQYQLDGKLDHGSTWSKYMRLMGQKAEQYASKDKIEAIGYVKPVRKTRTLVQCNSCGAKHKATSKQITFLTRCKCKCGGSLTNLGIKVGI